MFVVSSWVGLQPVKSYTAGYYLTYMGYLVIDLCWLQLSLSYPQMCNDCSVHEKYTNVNCYCLLFLAREAGILYWWRRNNTSNPEVQPQY